MKEYESLISFKFKANDWKTAQKGNINILELLEYTCNILDVKIECKSLKEIDDDTLVTLIYPDSVQPSLTADEIRQLFNLEVK